MNITLKELESFSAGMDTSFPRTTPSFTDLGCKRSGQEKKTAY